MSNASPTSFGPTLPRGQLSRQLKLNLATNVTHLRQRAGLTQQELAEAAELSRATIHLIEAGACDPRLSTITSLAEALAIDALRLLAPATPARTVAGTFVD